MNFKGISFFLGLSCWPVAILSFVNILYSSYFDHYLNLNSYLITLFISLFSALTFNFIGKNAEKNLKLVDQILLILFVYFFISLLIAIPYFFSNYQIPFADSLFEAVSGINNNRFYYFYQC